MSALLHCILIIMSRVFGFDSKYIVCMDFGGFQRPWVVFSKLVSHFVLDSTKMMVLVEECNVFFTFWKERCMHIHMNMVELSKIGLFLFFSYAF